MLSRGLCGRQVPPCVGGMRTLMSALDEPGRMFWKGLAGSVSPVSGFKAAWFHELFPAGEVPLGSPAPDNGGSPPLPRLGSSPLPGRGLQAGGCVSAPPFRPSFVALTPQDGGQGNPGVPLQLTPPTPPRTCPQPSAGAFQTGPHRSPAPLPATSPTGLATPGADLDLGARPRVSATTAFLRQENWLPPSQAAPGAYGMRSGPPLPHAAPHPGTRLGTDESGASPASCMSPGPQDMSSSALSTRAGCLSFIQTCPHGAPPPAPARSSTQSWACGCPSWTPLTWPTHDDPQPLVPQFRVCLSP